MKYYNRAIVNIQIKLANAWYCYNYSRFRLKVRVFLLTRCHLYSAFLKYVCLHLYNACACACICIMRVRAFYNACACVCIMRVHAFV